MESTDVVIAGAGPTGLMLACELRLAGVDVALFDGLPARTGESRAGGIHARTMEILDQRGMLDRLMARGRPMQAGHFSGLRMDFSDLDTRYPYTLAVVQTEIEKAFELHAAELGTHVQWASRIDGLHQDDTGVHVEVTGPSGRRVVRAEYLVGCDGGRSTVRKQAAIGFPGTGATMSGMLADVELRDPPADVVFSCRRGPGNFSVMQYQPGWYRLIVQRYDRVLDRSSDLMFDEFRAHFTEVAGTDYGMHSPAWVSHFGDTARHADTYRQGRVFLAGDAAHIHYPAGGQGLNLGVQDAFNLGWKLAAALHGQASEDLLDTYTTERHPIAARVLHNTRAQTALARSGPHTDALRDVMLDLIGIDAVRQRLALMVTGLDIRYDMTCTHPLAGRRIPDIDLTINDHSTSVHSLLRTGRAVLLSLGADHPAATTSQPWHQQVDIVAAQSDCVRWTVPGLGEITAPAATLIRPDGYVAWATEDSSTQELTEALADWFGASQPRRVDPGRKSP
ncbi:FAD-dependent monooxygenase [Nocardia sp. NBC_00416]|uniref:FAD-dependent monooxygenase n=1 Tax=Nocardia sp. NBC_00416 TaxID=2975991 RepID=UPI002E1FE55C